MNNALLFRQVFVYFKEHPDYIFFEIGSVTYNAIRYAAIAEKSFSISPK